MYALQVEDQANLGAFCSTESEQPTEIIINIGDLLQRLTKVVTLKAACHRVTYPPAIKEGDSVAISVAYFENRMAQLSLPLLRIIIMSTVSCRYEDVTAWQWNDRRIAKLFYN
ncbi:hypothetical protein Q7P35_012021 [Cladosporium inversicolor]